MFSTQYESFAGWYISSLLSQPAQSKSSKSLDPPENEIRTHLLILLLYSPLQTTHAPFRHHLRQILRLSRGDQYIRHIRQKT